MSGVGTLVVGGGVTGLAAGHASRGTVVEAAGNPGGICASYYLRPGSDVRLAAPPAADDAYRFEYGGGHWIFGGDPAVVAFLHRLAPMASYRRRSSVFFPSDGRFVPFPLQNHLAHLGAETAATALSEMAAAPRRVPATMAEWVEQSFGATLTAEFFGPFHELYTAGLWRRIAPQDAYKSPADLAHAIAGAFAGAPAAGYNVTFVYPREGLDGLARHLAARVDVRYGARLVGIETEARVAHFADGSSIEYDRLVSTLPLHTMAALAGVGSALPADPHTSVLVLNLGAAKGPKCPDDHWIYVPASRAGFHRVGFYSNVDTHFLPAAVRSRGDHVSLYVERAYPAGARPDAGATAAVVAGVSEELREWGFIGAVEAADATWVDVAYTWAWPNARWRVETIRALEVAGIVQVGRYGRWVFQGIADSVRDGLAVGATVAR